MTEENEYSERLEMIEQVAQEQRKRTERNYVLLVGDGRNVGMINRIISLEEAQSELMKNTGETLGIINDTLKSLHIALLGNVEKKERGLIALVLDHETTLMGMKKLGWIIAGSLIGIVVLQLWNTIKYSIMSSTP